MCDMLQTLDAALHFSQTESNAQGNIFNMESHARDEAHLIKA